MKGIQNQLGKPTENVLSENKAKLQHKSFHGEHEQILFNLTSSITGKFIIVEAQRSVKVLDQLIQDIEFCLYLDAEFIARFQVGKYSKDQKLQITEETIKLLQLQAELEQKFKVYANFNIMITQGEEFDESKKQESEKLEHLLQENFKNLLRRMQRCPKDFEILKGIKRNLNIELSEYLYGIKCLKILFLKELSITQAEKNIQIQQFQNIKSKVEEQEKVKRQLEQDLYNLKQQNSINTDVMKAEIEKLKQALQKLKNEKKQQVNSLQDQLKSQYNILEKSQQTKIDQLQAELQGLRSKFIKLRDENAQEETKLKRLNIIQDQALQEGVQNYDIMMEETIQKFNNLQKECQHIEQQLRDRKQYFLIVDAQKRKEKELEEEFKKKKDAHYLQQSQKTEAAKHIQLFFKSYQTSQKKPIKLKQG
ncbi:unnamed protein product [Paramecium sonneborni]|uniref:Dynein regulatory complex protein 10 n=1 Tax=Paramecium sonneborni TaxID=65129 RepID=A0A8S1N777_9CILI|nr:unnamed protein product [Paramecium sonneborni]